MANAGNVCYLLIWTEQTNMARNEPSEWLYLSNDECQMNHASQSKVGWYSSDNVVAFRGLG
jgi:hypothetical protein